MVVLIWLFSFLASSPTLFMSRYWVRSADANQFNFHSVKILTPLSPSLQHEKTTDSVPIFPFLRSLFSAAAHKRDYVLFWFGASDFQCQVVDMALDAPKNKC